MCSLFQLPRVLLGEVVIDNPLVIEYYWIPIKLYYNTRQQAGFNLHVAICIEPCARDTYGHRNDVLSGNGTNQPGHVEGVAKNGPISMIAEVSLWTRKG